MVGAQIKLTPVFNKPQRAIACSLNAQHVDGVVRELVSNLLQLKDCLKWIELANGMGNIHHGRQRSTT